MFPLCIKITLVTDMTKNHPASHHTTAGIRKGSLKLTEQAAKVLKSSVDLRQTNFSPPPRRDTSGDVLTPLTTSDPCLLPDCYPLINVPLLASGTAELACISSFFPTAQNADKVKNVDH